MLSKFKAIPYSFSRFNANSLKIDEPKDAFFKDSLQFRQKKQIG